MITKVNDTDLRILSLFTKGYDKGYYIREVEKLLDISSRTALVTLAKLEKKGVLESRTRGKTKIYSIRKTAISREYFILAEQHKRIRFLEKNHLIKEVLEKTEAHMRGIVIVFGSYAKGIQKNDSDLDIFIVGKYDREEIESVSKKYRIDVNVKSYPLKIFETELHDDFLLKEISEDHILVKDTEGFVRRILRWTR
jgi:predicted nucleotidyltransferase